MERTVVFGRLEGYGLLKYKARTFGKRKNRKSPLLLFFAVFFVATQVMASQEHYASYAAFLATHPSMQPQSMIFDGDLNDDGVQDKVVLLVQPGGRRLQIFVLKGSSHGGFDVTGKSDAFDYDWGYKGWVSRIAKYTKNGFLITFVANGNNDISSYTYKFHLDHGVWRLAGAEFESDKESDGNSQVISVNFLTGHFISRSMDRENKVTKARHGDRHFRPLTLQEFKYYDTYGLGSLWDD